VFFFILLLGEEYRNFDFRWSNKVNDMLKDSCISPVCLNLSRIPSLSSLMLRCKPRDASRIASEEFSVATCI